MAAPLAGLRFCPTGGIGAEIAPAYLALANVACVASDWARVERLAVAAMWMKRP